MKRVLLVVALITLSLTVQAQEVVVEAQFETRFDNREYSANDFGEAMTLFGMSFSPEVGLQWAEKNRLMVGANLNHEFGDQKALSEAALMVYYQFRSPSVQLNAGIFPRSKMIGEYSEAIFDDKTTFYHDPLQGLLFNYRSQASQSYAELLVDWEGLRTETQREKFRILADGRWDDGRFWAGGSLMMLHYAKTLNEAADEGVVDNLLLNPYVGVRFGGQFQVSFRLGYLQAMQRDRKSDTGWLTPKGGELYASISRWGLTLDNRLYVGENLQPLYGIYGQELFEGSTFYGVTGHIYNRTAVSYSRSFFNDTLQVDAALVAHYDGTGVGFQQVLKIGVGLERLFGKKR